MSRRDHERRITTSARRVSSAIPYTKIDVIDVAAARRGRRADREPTSSSGRTSATARSRACSCSRATPARSGGTSTTTHDEIGYVLEGTGQVTSAA